MLSALFKGEKRLGVTKNDRHYERDRQALLIFSLGELLHQSQRTLHLAVAYIDKMVTRKFSTVNEELTAVTSLLLAAKFNEVDDNIPLIEELIKAYSTLSIYEMS